jgi:mannosyl-3-phosphoglycerate phosphatase family protein
VPDRETRLIVFSDLDGTLLDFETYSFEAAGAALEALARRRIPLVLCTSKTRAETEPVRRALCNADPFVTENGGAIYIPDGTFPFEEDRLVRAEGYGVIVLGTPYRRIREALAVLRETVEASIRGFGDMDAAEVGRLSGLSEAAAELARRREYDEPFVVRNGAPLDEIRRAAGTFGLQVVTGGRFHHLLGANDKGLAVKTLRRLYERTGGPVKAVGLGDSANDLPLLENVDIPVLVRKADGRYDPDIRMEGLVRAPGIGPDGWREAVLAILAGGSYGPAAGPQPE